MDTSRNGFYNIGLLSNQQTLMIFGGFLFVGGIALLGFNRPSAAVQQIDESSAPLNEEGENNSFLHSIQLAESRIISAFPKWPGNSTKAKLIVSCISSLPFALLSSVFSPIFGVLVIAGFAWYSLKVDGATYNLLYVMSGVFFVISGLFLLIGLSVGGFFESLLPMTIPALFGEAFRIALKTRDTASA